MASKPMDNHNGMKAALRATLAKGKPKPDVEATEPKMSLKAKASEEATEGTHLVGQGPDGKTMTASEEDEFPAGSTNIRRVKKP